MKKIIFVAIFGIVVLVSGYFIISCDPIAGQCFGSGVSQEEIVNTNLSPSEFSQAVDSGEFTLLDVRTIKEYNEGHIDGSVQNDFYQTQAFSDYLDSLDKNEKYLIYCRSGNRSGQALEIMKAKGFTNVSDLDGGIGAWTGSEYPVVQ